MVEKPAYYEGRTINQQLVELYLDRLGPTERLLDLGCGTGGFGLHTGDGIVVIGTDIDEHALREARTHEEVVRSDVSGVGLPFGDTTFDGVVAKDILEHLDEPRAAVDEIYRVLEPGGKLVASVPMAKPAVVWGDYTHIRGFTENAIRMLFEDAGFSVESVSPMGGVRGFGRFGLVHLLPRILQIPGLRRNAVSHEVVCWKPT